MKTIKLFAAAVRPGMVIDLDLLQKQKEWLYTERVEHWPTSTAANILDGLIEMIESIQDVAEGRSLNLDDGS